MVTWGRAQPGLVPSCFSPAADFFLRTKPILLRRAAMPIALLIKLVGALADLLLKTGGNASLVGNFRRDGYRLR